MANHLLVREPHALIPAQVAAAGADRHPAFSRIFHRQHPQPQHPGRLRPGGCRFFPLVRGAGLRELGRLEPVHVAAYVEQLGKTHAAP